MTVYKFALTLGLVTCAAVVHADVTFTSTMEGNAAFIDLGSENVTQIKGLRQRTDQMLGKRALTALIDVDGRRLVSLNAKKKSADVMPLAVLGDRLAIAGTAPVDVTLTKTAQTKQVAGYPCTVHNVRMSLSFSITGEPSPGTELRLISTGTVCLSTAVPGLADYQAFHKAAAESGFIFGDPRAAKSPTGAAQARSYAELTRKMAEAGMILESTLSVSADGDSPMGGMLGGLVKSDMHMTVTKVTASDLPAEAFEIPADYKVKMLK